MVTGIAVVCVREEGWSPALLLCVSGLSMCFAQTFRYFDMGGGGWIGYVLG